MVKKVYIQKILSDEKINSLEGKWIDESYIKKGGLINTDSDIILKDNRKEIIIAKFRKGAINNQLCDLGWENYRKAATPSRGRGASAGPIDVDNKYWKKRIPVKTINKYLPSQNINEVDIPYKDFTGPF